MLTQSIVNEIDIIFFAHLPCPESSNAQAALLPSLIVLWLFGGSLSRHLGRHAGLHRAPVRRAKRTRTRAPCSPTRSSSRLVAGVLFTIVGYLAMPFILGVILKVPGRARRGRAATCSWRLLGITSMAATFAFKAFFDGIGKTHVHLVSRGRDERAQHRALLRCFIFGNSALGVPKMGIAGAGFAGVVSTYVGLAIMVGYALLPEYREPFRPFSLGASSTRGAHLVDPQALDPERGRHHRGDDRLRASSSRSPASSTQLRPPAWPRRARRRGRAGERRGDDGDRRRPQAHVHRLPRLRHLDRDARRQSLGEQDADKAERFGWASVRLGLVDLRRRRPARGGLRAADPAPSSPTASWCSRRRSCRMRMMGICTPLIAVGMILTQALFGAGNTRFVMFVELVLHFTCLVPLAWLLGITLHGGLVGIWRRGGGLRGAAFVGDDLEVRERRLEGDQAVGSSTSAAQRVLQRR